MTIEISVLVLVFLLAAILTIYNHRQAAALRGIERLVQDFVALQIGDRRNQHVEGLAERINPFEWLSSQVSAELDAPLTITEVARTVPEAGAVELRASNNKRIVVSTFSKSEIMRYDHRMRASGKGKSAKDRVASFAAHPLLDKSRWIVIERVMSQTNEFFDLEAEAVAKRIGVQWDKPSRLWFYVAK